MAYQLEGRMLEVCSCNVICPCWLGEDPTTGTCDTVITWHIDKGTINDVDVSGRTLAVLAHVPGNALKGKWRAVVYVDDGATPQQQEALLNVWTGKLGGPVADVAGLIGEVSGVERVPITYEIEECKGRLQIGSVIEAEVEAFQGVKGQTTTLRDSVFTDLLGSPSSAYVSKAAKYMVNAPNYGFNVDLQNHSALQTNFRFQA